VCWFAQQAAEKALEAALVLEGIKFPLRHDLDALRNLLPDCIIEDFGRRGVKVVPG
jgi:HEPN domain-containing protein